MDSWMQVERKDVAGSSATVVAVGEKGAFISDINHGLTILPGSSIGGTLGSQSVLSFNRGLCSQGIRSNRM